MSAAVAQRNAHHLGPQPPSRTNSPMDSKRSSVKSEDKKTKGSPKVAKGDSASKKSNVPTIANETGADAKPSATNADGAAPLAPPPKPSTNEGGDYFSGNHQTNQPNLSEQNPFDSAFANTGKLPQTPGGTQLPPVASLTSPAGQLTGASTGSFNWGQSLRAGPLSPAMLSGPAGEDYFSTNVGLGRGFPTPNESSLRTGLTPGGGGSMFPPAPSPNTQAIFSQLGGFQTPGTLEFQRTAMNVKKDPFVANPNAPAATSKAPTTTAGDAGTTATASSQNFDQHDAANGLFMLAQAGTESQANSQFAMQNQASKDSRNGRANNGSISNVSDATAGRSAAPSEEADQKPNTRNKGKGSKSKSARKAEEAPAKAPAKKKGKGNNGQAQSANQFEQEPPSDMDDDDDEDRDGTGDQKDTKKMTDEEKRKNFLERNRVAALKCRQRKKQWLANLQAKVEIYTSENDALTAQVSQLREEILNLKTILIAHKDCPIAQQQTSIGQYIPTQHPDYGAHPGAYGQFGQPAPGQIPNMANGPRRYS